MGLVAVLYLLFALGLRSLGGVAIAMTALALLDCMYQYHEHRKKLRMSRQEVRDEYKQSEGDPHVKARLRQIRNERSRQRMMQAVPTADVVITNPTHFAVALKKEKDVLKPQRAVARRAGQVAFRIRAVAEEEDG